MDAARTKHILDKALWHFAEQGLHTPTMAEITRHVAVSVGTLFRHLAKMTYCWASTSMP